MVNLFKSFGAFSTGVFMVYLLRMFGYVASCALGLRSYINQPHGELGLGILIFSMMCAASVYIWEWGNDRED